MARRLNTTFLIKTVLAALLLAAVVVAGGRLLSRNAIGNALPKARDLAKQQQYDEAARMFAIYLEQNAQDENARAEHAAALVKAGRLQAASEAYGKVLELNPRHEEALLWLVKFHISAAAGLGGGTVGAPESWLKARDLAGQIIKAMPAKPDGYRCLAKAEMGLRQLDDAKSTLKTLIEKHPAEEQAYFDLADLVKAEKPAGDWRGCIGLCLKNNLKSWSAHLLAYHYLTFHGDPGAKEFLDRALALGPNEPDVLAAAAVAEEHAAKAGQRTGHAQATGRHVKAAVEFWKKLQAAAPADCRSYVGLGRMLLGAKGPDAALGVLREGLAHCDKSGELELRYQMIDILVALRRTDEARAELAEVRRLDFASPGAALFEGQCLLNEGHADAAAQVARGIIEQSTRIRAVQSSVRLPWIFQAHLLLGNCYIESGETGLAKSEFLAALELRPDAAPARTSLARSLLQSGQPTLAADEARKATAADPQCQEAWVVLAAALGETAGEAKTTGALDQAVTAAERAVQLRPAPDALLLLARLYKAADRPADADALFARRAASLSALMVQFEYYAATAQLDRAKETYDEISKRNGAPIQLRLAAAQVLASSPDEIEQSLADLLAKASEKDAPVVHKALADFYLDHQKPKEATEQLKAVAAADRDDTAARRLMLRLALDSGDRERAGALIDELARIEGNDSEAVICDRADRDLLAADRDSVKEIVQTLEPVCLKVSSSRGWELLGAARSIQGDLNEAIRCYQEALRANPRNVRAGVALVAAFNAAGRPQDATETLDRLRAVAPRSKAVQGLELDRLMREDNLEGAIALMRQKIAAQPDNASALLNLGGLLLAKGDMSEAEKHVREARRVQPSSVAAVTALAFLLKQTGRQEDGLALCNEFAAANPSDPQAAMCRAQYLESIGRVKEAAADLRAAVNLRPKDKEAWIRLAGVVAELEGQEKALDVYRKAAELEPPGLHARILLAEELALRGRPKARAEADAIADALLKETPDDANVHLLKARMALLRYDKLSEAEKHCRRAIELAPNSPTARSQLCLVYRAMGDLDRATEQAGQALLLEPKSVKAALIYAELLRRQKREGEAAVILERAPRVPPVAMAQAELASARSGPKAAAEILQAAIAARKGAAPAELSLRLAAYLEKAGSDCEAEAQLQSARKASGDSIDSVAALARFLEQRKRFDETDRLFAEAGADKAKSTQLDLLRADLLLARRSAEALGEAERLASKALDGKSDFSTASRILGDVAYARGDATGAVKHYREAFQADSMNAFAANNLAWVLAESGRRDEALPFAQEAVAASRSDASCLDTLGEITYQLGRYEESGQVLARCVETSPAKSASWYRLGRSLLKLGRQAEARHALQRALDPGDGSLSQKQRDDAGKWLEGIERSEKNS